MDARISSAKTNRLAAQLGGMFDPRPGKVPAQDAANLCARIAERAANLQMQFEHRPEIVAPLPVPAFDTNGLARLEGWKQKLRVTPSGVSCERETRDGQEVLHLRTTGGPLAVALRARVSLPLGSYRLTGAIRVTRADGSTNSVATSILRYSPTRYAVDQRALSGREINYSFRVMEPRAPDEIEIICDLRDNSSELWFDASALRLVRIIPKPAARRLVP